MTDATAAVSPLRRRMIDDMSLRNQTVSYGRILRFLAGAGLN